MSVPNPTGPGGGLVVAVDGGGSKTDAVALTRDGALVARAAGPGSSPQLEGLTRSVEVIDALVREVGGEAPLGRGGIARTGIYLSGLDLPREEAAYAAAIAPLAWSASAVIANDLWALLRTGTESPDAVAVVVGTGINALGVRSDGRVARFPALGAISGDWGGGSGLGEEALFHAVRAEDGRGPRTALLDGVREVMGVATVAELSEQLHFGERSSTELAALAPTIFAAARDGDAVAGDLVDRQAAEVVALAATAVHRLELEQAEVPVVLGGGIIRARDSRLLDGIRAGLASAAPLTAITIVDERPIVGAALLALESAGADRDALGRARDEVSRVP